MYAHHHGDRITPNVLADILEQEIFLYQLLLLQVLVARKPLLLPVQVAVSIQLVLQFQISKHLKEEGSSAPTTVLRQIPPLFHLKAFVSVQLYLIFRINS